MKRMTLAMLLMVLAMPVLAATHLVNPDGSGDFVTIQDAIDASSADDTILLGDGTFTGVGNRDLEIRRPLVFMSTGGDPALCIIDAEGEPLGFMDNDSAVTRPEYRFQGITFHDGLGMTALDTSNGKDLFFSDCRFDACAGVFNLEDEVPGGVPPTFDMENCEVLSCAPHPDADGGTLIHVAQLWIRESRFEGNGNGVDGGAQLIYASNLKLENSDFLNNFIDGSSTPLAESNGIGASNGDLLVVDCSFAGNTTGYCVKGFAVHTTIVRCRFLGNDGGGVRVVDPGFGYMAGIRDCLFAENDGYAITRSYIHLELEGCSFVNGGGLADLLVWANDGSANLIIDRCIFAHRLSGLPVVMYGGSPLNVDVGCSNLFGNADGNGVLNSWIGSNGNHNTDPIFCDWPGGDYTLYETSPCLPANNSCGVLIGSEGQGCADPTAVDPAPGAVAHLVAHPNPFNPKTRIHFTLPEAGSVTLTVHDASGRRVAVLIDTELRAAGEQIVDWRADGLPSGVYLARLQHDKGTLAEKLILLR